MGALSGKSSGKGITPPRNSGLDAGLNARSAASKPIQATYGNTNEMGFKDPNGVFAQPVTSTKPVTNTYTAPKTNTYSAPVAAAAPAAPAAPAISETDFINSDDVYLAALSRYNKQFEDLGHDIDRRGKDYNLTYGNSLTDLGALGAEDGTVDDWAFDNQQTAAGRSFQSLIQDFASRGLLHSGDYVRSSGDLKSSLLDQFNNMTQAKSQFDEGLNSERTSGASSQQSGIGQARAEALARYAAQYGSV